MVNAGMRECGNVLNGQSPEGHSEVHVLDSTAPHFSTMCEGGLVPKYVAPGWNKANG